MTSQQSQPNCSISARLIGKNAAVPKRLAQYGRELVKGFAARAKKETSTGSVMFRPGRRPMDRAPIGRRGGAPCRCAAVLQYAAPPGVQRHGPAPAVDDCARGGTAGRPMLQVLQPQALDAVLASVVRYFGGVKLGAGALLRAYTDTIAQALRNAPKVSLQPMQTLHCQLPYALEGWLRREIEAAGAQLLAVQHGARVTL